MQSENWTSVSRDLRTIALLNPRLALLLARGQPMSPRSYKIPLRWDTSAAETLIENHLQERMYQDAWITEVKASWFIPNLARGNSYRPVILDHAQRSYGAEVVVAMRMEGPDRKEITNGMVPLIDVVSNNIGDSSLMNKANVIGHDQNLYIEAMNLRAWDPATEVPIVVTITMNMLELSGCNLRSIGFDEAVCGLKKLGIYPE